MTVTGAGSRLPRRATRSWPFPVALVLAGVAALATVLIVHFTGARSRAAGGASTVGHKLDGEATWPAGSRPAPAVSTLRDQSGQRFSLASLRGRTVAVVFFDSRCHQECPLEGRALAQAERALSPRRRPALVVVSVNPSDTPSSTRAAVRHWGLAGLAPWHWLMGARGQLAPVWKAYHVFVGRPTGGDVPHTEAVYVVDQRGYERSAYLYPFAPRFVTHDLRILTRARRS